MSKLIISILVLVSSFSAVSQFDESKKFIFSYEPGLSAVNGRETSILYLIPTIQLFFGGGVLVHHKVNCEFLLGKRSGLELTGIFAKGTFKNPFDKYEETPTVSDQLLGVSYKHYFHGRNSTTSPNGYYFGLGVSVGRQNAERTIVEESIDPNTGFTITEVFKYYDGQRKELLALFSLEVGRQFVVHDKYLIGYGIQYGVAFGESFPFINSFRDQPLRYLGKAFIKLGYTF